MKLLQSFRYELFHNGEKESSMRKFGGACRYVFNKALEIQIANHEAGNKFISYETMAKQLTEWRNCKETSWLYDAPCHSLQHALKDLDRALRTSLPKEQAFPALRKKAKNSVFVIPILHKSNSIRTIAAFSSQNSAGSGTAKAERSSEKLQCHHHQYRQKMVYFHSNRARN
jgi:transposase